LALTIASQAALDAALRTDLATFIEKTARHLNPGTEFIDNWHLHAIAHRLEKVRRGELRRLIITMPPRSLKSISASVAFIAFLHGLDPTRRAINVTYSNELSIKHARDYRSVITADWYRRIFPKTRIDPRKDSEGEIALTEQGGRLATSIGGVLTGRGADIIVVDDPLKAADAHSTVKRQAVNDWFGLSLVSRLNDKATGAIIVVTQRLHSDDLVGHLLQGQEKWEVLDLPAIAQEDVTIEIGDGQFHEFRKGQALQPLREPVYILERLRDELGPSVFDAQYLQRPVPPGGNLFKKDWLRYYDTLPDINSGSLYQSWDTAQKDSPASDWSVGTTWLRVEGMNYLVGVFRKRMEYPELKAKALAWGKQVRPRMIIIEDCGVGTALITELRQAGLNVHRNHPVLSKEERAAVQAATFAGGRVLFPAKASWLPDLVAELLAFPNGKHDDQVDSITQALAYEGPAGGTTTKVYGLY
jgi:predicted phage terminase large subunit-like protein